MSFLVLLQQFYPIIKLFLLISSCGHLELHVHSSYTSGLLFLLAFMPDSLVLPKQQHLLPLHIEAMINPYHLFRL